MAALRRGSCPKNLRPFLVNAWHKSGREISSVEFKVRTQSTEASARSQKVPWSLIGSFVAGTALGYGVQTSYQTAEKRDVLEQETTSGKLLRTVSARTAWRPDEEPPDLGNPPRSKRFNFIADAVEIAAPAVVYIEVTTGRHGWHSLQGPTSAGSGFIVTENGLVLTNAHVVENARVVTIRLRDGRQFSGTVVDIDPVKDLAAIRLNADENIKFPTLTLGSSVSLRPGEWVVAMGSPLQLSNTITSGIVSTVHRAGQELGLPNREMEYIQTDAAINVGNSGGPLVNLDGEVIGINAITVKFATGISFAIPIDEAKSFLQGARKREKSVPPQRWYIGISMLTLTPYILDQLHRDPKFASVTSGVFVADVNFGSPAHRAGLHKGDIITKINDIEVTTSKQVYEYIKKGQTLNIEVQRGKAVVLLCVQPQVVA